MKISAVIVTYNRLDLLKECVESVKNQSHPLYKVIIINNKSTDGTEEYLEKFDNDDSYQIRNMDKNEGGAGGFYEGIKIAVNDGADWVWVMDDDTIPTRTALEELVKGASVDEKIGFVCSKVLWKDGSLHKMNMPSFYSKLNINFPLHYYTGLADVLRINSASFVSLMVKCSVVKEVGLPIKEFFIWGDDVEFTQRISDKGYVGLYADKSIVLHDTKDNYVSDIVTSPVEMSWKFYYGIRNDLFLRRRGKNRIIFFFSSLNYCRRLKRKVNRRNDSKRIFRDIIRKAFKASISFNPQIKYISED